MKAQPSLTPSKRLRAVDSESLGLVLQETLPGCVGSATWEPLAI